MVLNGVTSSLFNVKSGAPQGSVLGPVLLLMNVNNIDNGFTCKESPFSDDTKIAS